MTYYLPDLLLTRISGIRLDNKDVLLNACRLSFIADKIQHLELTTFDNEYDVVKDKELRRALSALFSARL